jgi:hypothetical protein
MTPDMGRFQRGDTGIFLQVAATRDFQGHVGAGQRVGT